MRPIGMCLSRPVWEGFPMGPISVDLTETCWLTPALLTSGASDRIPPDEESASLLRKAGWASLL